LAAFRINWNRKSDSLIDLARELRLGLDSMVFIDDSPTECDEVRRLLPEVTVLQMPEDPAQAVASLRSLPELDRVVLTSEDRTRADQYRVERERGAREAQAAGDPAKLEEYLRSLALKVEVRRPNPDERARVAQLTQKTNQFNLTTIRRTEAEIDALMGDPAWRVFVLTVTDRFGDYGLVGVCIAEVGERFRLDTFLLSCRVLGRGVETAFFAEVARHLAELGCNALEAMFVETQRNAPARPFLGAHGFVPTPQGAWLRSPLDAHAISAPHIELAAVVREGGA
jgi:FkbH-like protein